MKNKIAILLIFLAGIFVLSSCLKDEYGEYWNDDLSGKMYATITKATLQQLALEPVAGDVMFSFDINIATDELPAEDITLTFVVDEAAIAAYNASSGKSYLSFPNVEILTKTVTIPAGTRVGKVDAKVWGAETLDACDNYMTAISIETVSGGVTVSKNMKSFLVSLPIKNPYAGKYVATGYRIHPSAGFIPFTAERTLNTVDCKTVNKIGTADYTGYSTNLEVTSTEMLDSLGNTVFKVIVTIPEIAAGTYAEYLTTDTGAPMNYYDPAKKEFQLYYYYSTAAPRKCREKVTRM